MNHSCACKTMSDVRFGDHICHIYSTEEEHRAVITPFLRQGLEQGEKVLYIVDARTEETILNYLRDDGVEVEPYLDAGQLGILSVEQAYLRQGAFEPNAMIALLREETTRAVAADYPGLRVTGEMTWALRGLPNSGRLIEYEAKLNGFLPGSRCVAICQYDRRRFDPVLLLDVLATHPLTAAGTELYENCYYVPPQHLLSPDSVSARLNCWIDHLVLSKQRALALIRAYEQLEQTIEERTTALSLTNEQLQAEIEERKRVERVVARQGALSDAVNKVFLRSLTCKTEPELANMCLALAEEITGSRFGFINELNEAGRFDTLSISDPGWEACRIPKAEAEVQLRNMELHGIRGKPIRYGKGILFNDPTSDPDWGGIPEGHPRITRFLGVPLKYRGRDVGVIGLANKETDYEPADQQIVETLGIAFVEVLYRNRVEADRERLIDELEAKTAEMESFTYSVSHDLKSPLITIRGFVGMIEQALEQGDLARLKGDIQRISRAAGKMQQLLDELLELSRIGRLKNPQQLFSITEVAGEAVEMVAGRITERGVEVLIDSDLPKICADRPRIEEVFQNLVDNAVKFMGNETHPQVEVGARRDNDETVFYVRDNGIGIAPCYHKKVFGLFEKLDPGTEGTGVGLALVKRIVETHGGRVWVESDGLGKGSTFCLTFPCLSPEKET